MLKKLFAATALLAFAAVAYGADELRWKFPADASYDVKLTQETAISTIVKTRPVKFTLALELEMKWRVTEKTEQQGVALEQTFTRIKTTMDSPGGDPLEYDSADDKLSRKEKAFAAGFAPLIGKSLTLYVSDLGEVEKVVLSPALKEHLATVAETSRLKELFTEKGLAELLRNSLLKLPADPVAVGDEWKDEDAIASPLGKLTRSRQYTYAGNGEIKQTSQLSISEGGEAPLTIKQQEQTGGFQFDVESGLLQSSDLHQKLTTESPYRDLKIQTTVESNQKLTITPQSN